VVDDEAEIRNGVAEYLATHGFSVETAADGVAMRQRLEERPADLVLLDLRMPGEDGLSLVGWLRTRGTAVIMLTALAEPMDRVLGLELGADDYIAKPFVPRELVARIRTVLRRQGVAAPASPVRETASPPQRVRFGHREVDFVSGQLIIAEGKAEPLTGMELELLRAFASHPKQLLSRDRLIQLAHNRGWDPRDRSIDVRIARIRKKIEPDPNHPRVIRTVRGVGYIFEPDPIP
jgi:DNA-binding response OmpR family regulator